MASYLAIEVPDYVVLDEVVNCVAHLFPGTRMKLVVLDNVEFVDVERLTT